MPYADEAECSYGWRTLGGSSRGRGGKAGGLLGRRIGHVRSGVVGSGGFYGGGGGQPIDYDTEAEGPGTIRYRCRARLARGGRIVFDRVPLLQQQHAPPGPPTPPPKPTATEQENAASTAPSATTTTSMPPPPPPGQHLHLHHPHPSSYHPLPADSITVTLSVAASLGQLEKYPTCDLQAGDVFRYPTRFNEILKIDDQEDEVVEMDPAAPSDPDPLLVLPSRQRPPETDQVALMRFQLRV